MNETKGSQLHPEDRKYVLSAYVYRHTKDHPYIGTVFAHRKELLKKTPYHFSSDNEWLENTFFHTKANGRLDRRYRFCHSTPTWPDNPELRTKK